MGQKMFFLNSRFIVISIFISNFLAMTCHAEEENLDDLIAQASFGDKIETVRAPQTVRCFLFYLQW